MSRYDFAARLEQAMKVKSLANLMAEYGHSFNEKGPCPFCKEKGASIYKNKGGVFLFKCFHNSCPSGTADKGRAWDQVGFLAFKLSMSRTDAAIEFLKMAGLWTERESHPPSVMPGKSARKRPRLDVPEEVTRDPDEIAFDAADPVVEPDENLPPESISETSVSEPSPAPSNGDFPVPKDGSQTAEGQAAVPPSPVADSTPPSGRDSKQPDGVSQSEKTRKPERGSRNGKGGDGSGGGGGDPPEPPVVLTVDDETPPRLLALREFYRQVPLLDHDVREMWVKRGCLERTCREVGLRSSPKSNREILEKLREKWSEDILVDAGLWLEKDGEIRPNSQYYGWGIKGKDPETGDVIWDWTHPVLIPYFNEDGLLIGLRPHKGNSEGITPLLYVVRRPKLEKGKSNGDDPALGKIIVLDGGASAPEQERKIAKPGMITEGEFKAIAFWQATNYGKSFEVAALPGITMAKPLFAEIEEWLSDTGSKGVTICYDNEDKGTELLPDGSPHPAFQPEEWKRFGAEVWSRYLADQLGKQGFDARVARLPNEWRNDRGKADWDGALAKLIKDGAGNAGDDLPEKIWNRVKKRIETLFRQVISGGKKVGEIWQAQLFDSKQERIIQAGLDKISRDPKLPAGGDATNATGRRLQRLVRKLYRTPERISQHKNRAFLNMMAKRYLDMDGKHYVLKELTDPLKHAWQLERDRAAGRDDAEMVRAADMVMKGIPNAVSDWSMECHYTLKKANGKRERLVKIRSIHKRHGVNLVTDLIALPSEDFAQPVHFRIWLLNQGPFTWDAGQTELILLQIDLNWLTAFRDVTEVPVRGWYPEIKAWIFEDAMFFADGREVYPDRSGIYWESGLAYKAGPRDHEGQEFCQGLPVMKPARTMLESKYYMEMDKGRIPATEKERVEMFYREVMQRFHETLGGYAGFSVMGSLLSFAAAPEIYATYTGFPGLWLHGNTGEGKSSLARWGLRFWGFPNLDKGVSLIPSTQAGLSVALQQYGNLPVWLEEFQPDSAKWILMKLQNAFDRSGGIKMTVDNKDTRRITTAPVVTGIATATDAQVKNRYCHVQVSEKFRGQDHFEWFQRMSPDFFYIGRWLLRNRKEFVRLTMDFLKAWLESVAMMAVDARVRLVHGVTYASMMAVGVLLGSKAMEIHAEPYRIWLVEACGEAVVDIRRQVNVNQFWTDIMSAAANDVFGRTSKELGRMFMVVKTEVLHPPGAESQAGKKMWSSDRLYFKPDLVIECLRKHKRQQGQEMAINRSDLQAQMKTQAYWVPPNPSVGRHMQRFIDIQGKKGKVPETCWCIDLDKHALGYQAIPDEVFESSLYRDGNPQNGVFWPSVGEDAWIDPRRGDMYALVDALDRKDDDAKKAGS